MLLLHVCATSWWPRLGGRTDNLEWPWHRDWVSLLDWPAALEGSFPFSSPFSPLQTPSLRASSSFPRGDSKEGPMASGLSGLCGHYLVRVFQVRGPHAAVRRGQTGAGGGLPPSCLPERFPPRPTPSCRWVRAPRTPLAGQHRD